MTQCLESGSHWAAEQRESRQLQLMRCVFKRQS